MPVVGAEPFAATRSSTSSGIAAEAVLAVEVADRARGSARGTRRRGPVALVVDQEREVGRVAVAHIDVDAGLLGRSRRSGAR